MTHMTRTLAQLEESIVSGDTEEQQIALDRIAMLQDPRAFELARRALDDPSRDVRGEAAVCLGMLRDPRSEAELIRVWRDDPDERVRFYAIMGLEAYTSDAVRDTCIEALGDELGVTRMKAARQLWKYDDDEVVAALKERVEDDDDANVRLHAADSLLFLFRLRRCPGDWLALWRRAADDEDSVGVRRLAARALDEGEPGKRPEDGGT